MRLCGIELRNFRSIGDDPVVLNPWTRCNILVGQNNSGKSNVLKAIKLISGGLLRRAAPNPNATALTELDTHRRDPEGEFRFKLHFECDDQDDEALARVAETRSFWFDFAWKITASSPGFVDNSFAMVDDPRLASALLDHLVNRKWNTPPHPADIRTEFTKSGSVIFDTQFLSAVPAAHIIPEFREIRQEEGEYQMKGTNLVELLHSYQHPVIGKDTDRDKFDLIQRFVRKLLHLPDAVLEVTAGDK